MCTGQQACIYEYLVGNLCILYVFPEISNALGAPYEPELFIFKVPGGYDPVGFEEEEFRGPGNGLNCVLLLKIDELLLLARKQSSEDALT